MKNIESIEKDLNDTELKMYHIISNQKPNIIYNIESKVGVGKIKMLMKIAEKMNLRFIEFRMSMCEVSDISKIDLLLNEPTLIIFNEIDRTVSSIQEKIFDIIIHRKTLSGLDINSDIYMVCCSGFDINREYFNNPIDNPYMVTFAI